MSRSDTCRLCMNTDALSDIYKVDGETTLDKKVLFCVGLKMSIGDGLPGAICKICEKNIQKFYDFKQKCINIDTQLRTMEYPKYSLDKLNFDYSDLNATKMDVKLECDMFNKLDSEVKNTFDNWFSDADSDFANYLSQTGSKYEKSKTSSEGIDILTNSHNANAIKQSVRNRRKGVTGYKIYQCEICGCVMKNKSVLAKHLAKHSGIKQFSCKLCPKTFTRAENKVIHMRTHLGIKPYICEVCGRSFTKRQDLIRHMRIHSDEKKYACPTCDRRFKRSSDIRSHMRTHTGAKPFRCNHCAKSYTSHSGLRKHYNAQCKRENGCIK